MGVSASAVNKLTARGVEQLRNVLHTDVAETQEAHRA
jgi:hypothetical protein